MSRFTSFFLIASICGLVACRGERGKSGATGPQGSQGSEGTQGDAGATGLDGLACWDLNGDRVQDAEEDTNGDSVFDARDCQLMPAPESFQEACVVCHGPGRDADVAVKHGITTPDYLLPDPLLLLTTITNIDTSSSNWVVEFMVEDQDGEAFAGLTASQVRFHVAQLVPGSAGDASRWQSYINRNETPASGVGTGNGSPELQATSETGTKGTFVNNDDGTYAYTLSFNITTVTTPIAVTYDATRTHLVAMQISGNGLPRSNPTYTFRPSDGATTGIATRKVVETATCNTCHDPLVAHGSRVEVDLCVACHNPGSTDANSDNTVDLKVMAHKIHMGRNLPSVLAGGEYAIWGYGNSKHDYSEVGFPQALNNCTRCHDGANPDTPDGDNWKNVPTAEACGSCHDDVNFTTGVNHVGGAQANNSQCANCHTSANVESKHAREDLSASIAFEFNITNVAFDSVSRVVTVDFSVTDPTNADQAYDILTDPEFTAGGGVSRLAVLVGWDTRDYHNTGSGNAPGQPISINPLSLGSTPASPNGDGTYRVTATLPTEATGTGVVALEGHPAGQDPTTSLYTLRVPVRSAFTYFAISDSAPVARRTTVDVTGKCDNCHGVLSMHGANRTDEAQVCVVCHNPNATDVSRRPADHTTTATADGAKEASIDFKHLIHAIHGAGKRENPYVAWGYGSTEYLYSEEEVTFPGLLSRCTTCHVGSAYTLPLAEGVLATTIDTAPAAAIKSDASAASLGDPHDDLNISPTAAVCSACHDSDLARAHMEHNGATFASTQAEIE